MDWTAMTLQTRSLDEDEQQKNHVYDCEPGDMRALVTWIGKRATRSFFLAEVPRHGMGDCRSRLGLLEFFDPNAGIIGSYFPFRLSKCLFEYFDEPHVKKAYRSMRGFVELDVKKFRAKP